MMWVPIAFMALSIPIVAIVMDGVKDIYQLRVKELAHRENIERLQNGYPPIEDKKIGKRGKSKHDYVIDMTQEHGTIEVKHTNHN